MDLEHPSLIDAIEKKDRKLALDIIKSGNFNPEEVNKNNTTPLMFACIEKMNDVALELIKTGKSKPEKVNKFGATALLMACSVELNDVALALVKTGMSKPEHADDEYSFTALLHSCNNNSSELALALIETGMSNPEHENKDGYTAYDYARKYNMVDVINALENLELPNIIVADVCSEEKESPISYDTIQDGNTVILSDGKCYSFDDVVNLYRSTINTYIKFRSPFTRKLFTNKDKRIAKMLIRRGHGTNQGGKKSRKLQKKKTTKPKSHKRPNKKTRKLQNK